jgi:tripartite-type tricarboxylate transporter receptor subunit TctC
MEMITRRQLVVASASLVGLAAPLVARAFPERPIKLVIPMAAGGGTDAVARMLAQKMAETLGQPLVIENKAGAAGQIGVESVMSAPKDGYTLLFCSSTPLTLPYLRQTRFDLLRDFVPLGQVSNGNFVLVTRKGLPFDSPKAFLDDAKRHPNK